jgi:hypothetical protein
LPLWDLDNCLVDQSKYSSWTIVHLCLLILIGGVFAKSI